MHYNNTCVTHLRTLQEVLFATSAALNDVHHSEVFTAECAWSIRRYSSLNKLKVAGAIGAVIPQDAIVFTTTLFRCFSIFRAATTLHKQAPPTIMHYLLKHRNYSINLRPAAGDGEGVLSDGSCLFCRWKIFVFYGNLFPCVYAYLRSYSIWGRFRGTLCPVTLESPFSRRHRFNFMGYFVFDLLFSLPRATTFP